MPEETLTYEADGLTMRGKLFLEEGRTPLPAVLVFPDLFGIGEHSIERAQRLAALGYAALACDLHGEGRTLADFDAARAELQLLGAAPERLRARAAGALSALGAHPRVDATRIAAIGFCFGGTTSLELARSGADVKAVVGFHSGLDTRTPAEAPIQGRILVCIGADDPLIPPEQRLAFEDEMRRSNARWQMHLYGNAVHNFTNPRSASMNMPDIARFDAGADAHSWQLMTILLHETLTAVERLDQTPLEVG